MVTKRKQHSSRRPVKQGRGARAPRPKNRGFHALSLPRQEPNSLRRLAVRRHPARETRLPGAGGRNHHDPAGHPSHEPLPVRAGPRAGPLCRLCAAPPAPLHRARDPILTGILQVTRLPPQSTLWRFLVSLHLNVAKQILSIQRQLRERVWAAAQVKLETVTLDTDTTVHTLYGRQMGGRKSYNPKNKGKRSYQPILTFPAETREYLMGGLRNGDRPTGRQIAAHLESAFRALPGGVKKILARADSGFYCWEAVPSAETVLGWYPPGNRILAQPERDVPAAPEATLVLPPVPDSVLRLVLAVDSARLPCGHNVAPLISMMDRNPPPMLACPLTPIHAPMPFRSSNCPGTTRKHKVFVPLLRGPRDSGDRKRSFVGGDRCQRPDYRVGPQRERADWNVSGRVGQPANLNWVACRSNPQ